MTLQLPPHLKARIEAEAKRRRVSKSQVAREALERGLTPSSARKPSLYDLIKDVVGSVEGPGDLSYNPKHMEGFGE